MSIHPEVAVSDRDSMEAVHSRIINGTAALYEELCNMANMNPQFRSGLLDRVSFEVREGMVGVPELTSEEMLEIDSAGNADEEAEVLRAMIESRMTFGYRFDAMRIRETVPGELKRQQAAILFQFEVYGRHEGVVLPPHIAQELMFDPDEDEEYMPARQAQHEMGLVEELRIKNFGFHGESFHLQLCEGTTYSAEDGSVLSTACSCPGEQGELIYIAGQTDEVDDEEGAVLLADSEIQQYLSDYAAQRAQSEPLELLDADTAIREWAAVEPLTLEVDTYDHERKVYEARILLRVIRAAFMRQFGIDTI